MNWNGVTFPSSQRRGGRDIKEKSRSLLHGADGVVRPAKMLKRRTDHFYSSRYRPRASRPSARKRWLRGIELIAHPPILLACEEGNFARFQFIHSPIDHRSEEHTSELQSHSFISYAVFCLKKK